MTKRQKAYRQYLKSDHWKRLRAEAIERYGNKCSECDCTQHIQIHHKTYRTPLESCTTDDLMPLCREHHEDEHGFTYHRFMRAVRAVKRTMLGFKRPSREEWRAVIDLMNGSSIAYEELSDLMFEYVLYMLSTERHGFGNWSIDQPELQAKWKNMALNIQSSIRSRYVPPELRGNSSN